MKKTLFLLQQNYCKFAPLCSVVQFIEDYKEVLAAKKSVSDQQIQSVENSFKKFLESSLPQDKDNDDRVNVSLKTQYLYNK